ncbi:MAG: MATE family efflux transporter, partial [Erysipelotrichaceae bacterium]|nr:MATE family efflux transporter [Erysipelotrichaceae bacterium]
MKKYSLFKYTWPIFIEQLLQIFVGNIDQIMIAADSQNSVAAVGNCNTIYTFIIMLFSFTSMALSILVSQYMGSNQQKKVSQVFILSLILNLLFSLLLVGILLPFQSTIFSWMQIPTELLSDTSIYLTIVVLGLPIQSTYQTYSMMYRTQGMMKQSMFITAFVNILNIVGNYCLIFGIGPIPALHVAGAAISSVGSRLIGLCILIYVFHKQYKLEISKEDMKTDWKKQVSLLFKIGLPAAGEGVSYNLSQLVIMSFINSFGTLVINTKVYVGVLASFSYVFGTALSEAAQIIVGYLMGAKDYDGTHKQVMKVMKWSIIVSVIISTFMYLTSDMLLSLFTTDPYILKLGKQILLIDIFLEIGRAVNTTMVYCL